MNLVAVMPLRNEDWIVGLSARVALKWCDGLVVLLHASSDRSADIIADVAAENPGRVTIMQETDPGWREMEHRQRLLVAARQRGATHIALVDADEVLCANLLPIVRGPIEALQPRQYLQSEMQCMWRNPRRVRTDGNVWSNRTDLVLAFADAPELNWSAADGGYQHHHRAPNGGRSSFQVLRPGGVMHLQWVVWQRLLSKHAWYQMHERLTYPAKSVRQIAHTYSLAPNENGLSTAPAPPRWWDGYADLMQYLDLESISWHEAECRRLMAAHGPEMFAGLDLHGVA